MLARGGHVPTVTGNATGLDAKLSPQGKNGGRIMPCSGPTVQLRPPHMYTPHLRHASGSGLKLRIRVQTRGGGDGGACIALLTGSARWCNFDPPKKGPPYPTPSGRPGPGLGSAECCPEERSFSKSTRLAALDGKNNWAPVIGGTGRYRWNKLEDPSSNASSGLPVGGRRPPAMHVHASAAVCT